MRELARGRGGSGDGGCGRPARARARARAASDAWGPEPEVGCLHLTAPRKPLAPPPIAEKNASCAHYPSDSTFLANVRYEIREQVMRLGSYASLAVWGGNNENEVGFAW